MTTKMQAAAANFGYEETNMDFDLTEEQRLLKESIDGLLTDSYDFERRKKYMKEKGGWSKARLGQARRAGPARSAVRGGRWRLRRRRRSRP